MVIMEAFEFGLPVIAFHTGAMDLIIDDGKTGYLPEAFDTKKFTDAMLKLADIPAEIPAAALKKAQRIHLRQTIKKLPLTITKARPIEEAIVTAGGISTKEVNSSTMESKIVRGLYLAGEVLDVHAFTGGYNLQAAFSMGRMAALSAAGDKTDA